MLPITFIIIKKPKHVGFSLALTTIESYIGRLIR